MPLRFVINAIFAGICVASPAVGAPLPAGTYEFSFRAKLIEESFDVFEPCFYSSTAPTYFDCANDLYQILPRTTFRNEDFSFLDMLGVEGRFSSLRGSTVTGSLTIEWAPWENDVVIENRDADTKITCSVGGIACVSFEDLQQVTLERGPPRRFQISVSQDVPAFYGLSLSNTKLTYSSDFNEANVGEGAYDAEFRISGMRMISAPGPLPTPVPLSLSASLLLGSALCLPLLKILRKRDVGAEPSS